MQRIEDRRSAEPLISPSASSEMTSHSGPRRDNHAMIRQAVTQDGRAEFLDQLEVFTEPAEVAAFFHGIAA